MFDKELQKIWKLSKKTNSIMVSSPKVDLIEDYNLKEVFEQYRKTNKIVWIVALQINTYLYDTYKEFCGISLYDISVNEHLLTLKFKDDFSNETNIQVKLEYIYNDTWKEHIDEIYDTIKNPITFLPA